MTHWTEEYLQQVEDCEQRESRLGARLHRLDP
jgi:hypothetical protein